MFPPEMTQYTEMVSEIISQQTIERSYAQDLFSTLEIESSDEKGLVTITVEEIY